MPGIREIDLPAIGKKFEVETRSGDHAAIIVHDNGRREFYVFSGADREEVKAAVTLEDEEARHLAAILGGLSYAPKALETARLAVDDLVFEWCKIEPGSPLVGHTIGELQVRQRTGATIIAEIDIEHKSIANPGPSQTITQGSTLVVVGERQHIQSFRGLLGQA
jgi:TrkA domain protein